MRVRDPAEELRVLSARSSDRLRSATLDALRSVARREPGPNERFARVIGETMALADLLGRRRLLLEADAASTPRDLRDKVVFCRIDDDATRFGAVERGFPDVPFAAALRDLLSREPRLARTAAEVADLYRSTHAFSMAHSASQALTARVQEFLAAAAREGRTAPSLTRIVEGLTSFSRAYADTVQQTNLVTAYTAGRFAQARDPVVGEVIGALERWEVLDSDVRRGRPVDGGENHAAAHGLIASARDRIWDVASPPAGYNCRGGVRFVSRGDLRRLGLLSPAGEVLRRLPSGFDGYAPHPNFRRSAFSRVYG